MMKLPKTFANIAACFFFIVVAAYLCTMLMLPLWYVLILVVVVAMIRIRKKKPGIFRITVIIAVLVLAFYYFAFEFVPTGNIPGKYRVNGVSFEEIVGTYYFGDGLGMNCTMEITEDGRFFFTWTGCLGVYDRNKGRVIPTEQTIMLDPKKSNHREGFGGTETVFIPVKWDKRIYLVPQNKMIDFCSEFNMKIEPRNRPHGRFYLREQDWEKPCDGLPEVGNEWREFLLVQPIRGKIIRLTDKHTGVTNLGLKDGLRKGMTLTAQSSKGYLFSTVVVESVTEKESTVRCRWKRDSLRQDQILTSVFHDKEETSNK